MNTSSAAMLEISVEQVGVAGSELPHVAEKDAVVARQVQFAELPLGHHLDLHRAVRILPGIGIEREFYIVRCAPLTGTGRLAIDAQHLERWLDLRHQPAVIVDIERITRQVRLDKVIARRLEALA